MVISKSALGIAAGICGTLFVGYCIYFDKRRRSDPNFKKKLRERRKANREAANKSASSGLPDLKNHEEVQNFFLREIQLGEEKLAVGEIETGVEHLSNAVAVCGQPQQLLQVLQQTIPPQVFHMLIQRLPIIGQKLVENQSMGAEIIDEDVE